jgi:citrate lyase subunit beta/citryl-CoA lyase
MAILVRRSNLLVPITNPRFVSQAWRHHADAVTLDLEDGVVEARKAEARSLVKEAVALVGQGAAEVFVRVNKPFVQADLEASVWPGVRGIMLPRVEAAEEVVEAAQLLTMLERQRGIAAGSLQLIALLESARGVWHMRSILTASPRLTQVGLDESDLACNLGLTPLPEYDPYVYARGRLAIEATATGVQPLGMAYPLGTLPRLLAAAEIHRLATDARNLGMKGVICPHPSWVAPVNTAFTPTTEQVNYNRRVREVFAQAVASGTAAVPLDGRMIDVPVDEWAKVVLAMADACAARDAEKQAALDRLAQSAVSRG